MYIVRYFVIHQICSLSASNSYFHFIITTHQPPILIYCHHITSRNAYGSSSTSHIPYLIQNSSPTRSQWSRNISHPSNGRYLPSTRGHSSAKLIRRTLSHTPQGRPPGPWTASAATAGPHYSYCLMELLQAWLDAMTTTDGTSIRRWPQGNTSESQTLRPPNGIYGAQSNALFDSISKIRDR